MVTPLHITIANLVNMIANITAKELDVSREDIERPYAPSENASEARAIIAKVAVSFGIPISAIRRIIKRNENLTMYYLAHEARENIVREVKRKTQFYLDQLENIKDFYDEEELEEDATNEDAPEENPVNAEDATPPTSETDTPDIENGPS